MISISQFPSITPHYFANITIHLLLIIYYPHNYKYFMNNSNKPVDLAEKIDYLHEKIDHVHAQVKRNGAFELRMKFIEYIDTSIENIYNLANNKHSSEKIPKKYEEYYSAEQNSKEKERIENEKQALS